MYIPQGDPRETFSENHSSIISCSHPQFWTPKGPRAKMAARGVQIWPLDPKTKKMRAEKWCRTPPELIQTEPGGSCGHLLRVIGDSWGGRWCFQDMFGDIYVILNGAKISKNHPRRPPKTCFERGTSKSIEHCRCVTPRILPNLVRGLRNRGFGDSRNRVILGWNSAHVGPFFGAP